MGALVVGVFFIVFFSTIYTKYIRSHKSILQENTTERETVEIKPDSMPEIDWSDMALYFNISNRRVETKKKRGPVLGSVKIPTIIAFDIEAKETLEHPFFLARFLDTEGRDVLRSKPLEIEPENNEIITSGWKPGNKGTAHFIIDKDKISQIARIKITKRIKQAE